jgi:hypothetical protein
MDLPNEWIALLALVFILGAKHGLDADHLATIDGLTRYNLRMAPRRARWCGSLFSLGHGAIVLLIALASAGLDAWQVPEWMEDLGTWISIGFLTLLGVLNLRAVLTAPAGDMVATIGIKAGPAAPPAGDLASAGDRCRGSAVRPVLRHPEPGCPVRRHRHTAWRRGPHPGDGPGIHRRHAAGRRRQRPLDRRTCCAAPTTAPASPRA